MKKIFVFIILSFVVFGITTSFNIEAQELPDLTETLNYLKSYRFGMSRAQLEPLENVLRQTKNLPEKQERLSTELAKILPECTIDGKQLIARYLVILGTPSITPYIEPLFQDPATVDIGCRILEQIPGEQGTKTLMKLLTQSQSEQTKIAVLHSLARREDPSCIDDLARLLPNSEGKIREAVLFALSSIPDKKAGTIVWDWAKNQDFVKESFLVETLLKIAENISKLEEGKPLSKEIFQRVYSQENIPSIYRGVAISGLVSLDPEGMFEHVWNMALGEDKFLNSISADLLKSSYFSGEIVTQKISNNLNNANKNQQLFLLEVIRERKLTGVLQSVINLLNSDELEVKTSTLKTLGVIGDVSCLEPLFQLAIGGTRELKEVAYDSLCKIPDMKINSMIIEKAKNGNSEERRLAVKLMGERKIYEAKDLLKEFIRNRDELVINESFSSLVILGDEIDISFLFGCLLQDEKDYSNIISAITLLLDKINDEGRKVNIVMSNMPEAKEVYQKKAIVELLGNIHSPEACNALNELIDKEPTIVEPIIQAMGKCNDEAALQNILRVIRSRNQKEIRIMGSLSILNILRALNTLPDSQKFMYLQEIWSYSQESSVLQKGVLGSLSKLSLKDAFDFVGGIKPLPEVASDWNNARLELARNICFAYPLLTLPILEASLPELKDKEATEMQGVVNGLKNIGNYLCAWSVSGPYQIDGYNAYKLFNEVSFPPETNIMDVKDWRILPMKVREDGVIYGDLFKYLQESVECVAYVCTKITLPEPSTATLLLGTNDGVKVWLNGKRIHAYPDGRNLTPGEDKILLNLESSNILLLAIYNQGAQWEFSVSLEGIDTNKVTIEPFRP